MALDRAARSLLMSELLSGLRLTLKHMFNPKPREELLCNKERLLSNGDCWEPLLSRRLELDAPCR